MSKINCKKCKYYLPEISYCTKLKTSVINPENPPCLGKFFIPNNMKLEDSSNNSPLVRSMLRRNDASITNNFAFLKYESRYAPTGISKLDAILKGGVLRGKTYLIAGETGCGKTIFSLQFLIYGASRLNEPGVYLAIDEPSSHIIKGLKSFGWDLKELVESRKLLFLDMRGHFRKLYLRDKERRIDPHVIIDSIIKNVRKINAKRLVIDPIAPLMYGSTEEDILYAREFLREMIFSIEGLENVTTIITSEIPTGSNKLSRFGVEEFLATGIIVLTLYEVKGKIYRVIYIRKTRWAPVAPAKYIFEIHPGVGIIIKGSLDRVLS